jgi:glycerol-3-phosphate dehydrogenase (NAD(P)+)
VAHLCAHNVPTVLWARDAAVVSSVNDTHSNDRYLPGYALHPALRATTELAEAVSGADVVVMGVPSTAFADTLDAMEPHLRAWVPVISLTKGLERSTGRRMTELVEQRLPGRPVGALTGPNLAKEIMAGQPAATVLSMTDVNVTAALHDAFATTSFRVFTNPDIIGCELGGALKNVVAIAAGIAAGLGGGANTTAAIITRGLAEMTRLGVALGGQPLTFAGLAGMGDLIATCTSPQSRNRHVGEQLGQGRSLAEISAGLDQVAEVRTGRVGTRRPTRCGHADRPSGARRAVRGGHRPRGPGEPAQPALALRTRRSGLIPGTSRSSLATDHGMMAW